jgi:RNase H-like domain found in reverse transcriptase
VASLRRVLGMSGYYREYIPNYALETQPMAELLEKNVPWHWSEACRDALDNLKLKITSDPILELPDMTRPFILTTDWSKLAIGAVLFQEDPDTHFDHPISFPGC